MDAKIITIFPVSRPPDPDPKFALTRKLHHARPFVGLFQNSILDRFVKFWRLFPAKWLQNRPEIPKLSPGITPRRAFGSSGWPGDGGMW